MANAKTTAQNLIAENGVVVFSKSYCPYCSASKKLLNELGAEYKLLELDEISDGQAIQDALYDISSQRTVPNIFIGQKHIGGNSDLQGKSREQLKKLLKDAGAL
ncbi:glutaredoxin, partial [Aspergillus saccharolyticus JOP 1030-1]